MNPDCHILVVEDDPDTRRAMRIVLEGEGYRVDGAANGQEALDFLRQDGKPCVILLDLMMPVMDGWRFREEQSQDPNLAEIPVVVVSADGNVPQKASALGAAGYIQKPAEIDLLLQAFGEHC